MAVPFSELGATARNPVLLWRDPPSDRNLVSASLWDITCGPNSDQTIPNCGLQTRTHLRPLEFSYQTCVWFYIYLA